MFLVTHLIHLAHSRSTPYHRRQWYKPLAVSPFHLFVLQRRAGNTATFHTQSSQVLSPSFARLPQPAGRPLPRPPPSVCRSQRRRTAAPPHSGATHASRSTRPRQHDGHLPFTTSMHAPTQPPRANQIVVHLLLPVHHRFDLGGAESPHRRAPDRHTHAVIPDQTAAATGAHSRHPLTDHQHSRSLQHCPSSNITL